MASGLLRELLPGSNIRLAQMVDHIFAVFVPEPDVPVFGCQLQWQDTCTTHLGGALPLLRSLLYYVFLTAYTVVFSIAACVHTNSIAGVNMQRPAQPAYIVLSKTVHGV